MATFIERLAQLGDVTTAEALASVAAPPEIRAMFIGKVGRGRARAGDVAGALKAADAVATIPDTADVTSAVLVDAKAAAIADIGVGLDNAGATDAALRLANSLSDGLPKLQLLSRTARTMCKSRQGGDETTRRGQHAAEQAIVAAQSRPATGEPPGLRSSMLQFAAEAVAACDGPDDALSFVRHTFPAEQANLALGRISDSFMADGETSLARALAPKADPNDPDSLFEAARRFARQGDKDAARATVAEAARVALSETRESMPLSRWSDHLTLLDGIFGFLCEFGEYDRAIASVQPQDSATRRQFYVNVVAAAIRNNDKAAAVRLVPSAIHAAKEPKPDWGSVQQLRDLTRVLAMGGCQDAAQAAFEALKSVYGELTQPGRLAPDPVTMAELQAVTGDLPGALAAADRAGPLAAKPNAAMALFIAGMAFGNLHKTPTTDDVTAQMDRARAALPSLVPGPRADALAAVSRDMAAMGNVDAALQAEAGLEGEPREVLAPRHDTALSAISEAYERAGNLEASLATAMRITQPLERWGRLLVLAAISPRS